VIPLVRRHHFYADHRSADVCRRNPAKPYLDVHELRNAAPAWPLHTPATSRCRFHARRRPSCHLPEGYFPHSS
jgi:hypothetical protein